MCIRLDRDLQVGAPGRQRFEKDQCEGTAAISRIRDPLPTVSTARHPAGFDDDIGVRRDDRRKVGARVGAAAVIDLREWKYAAVSRVGFENSTRPIAVHSRSRVARMGRDPSVVRRP